MKDHFDRVGGTFSVWQDGREVKKEKLAIILVYSLPNKDVCATQVREIGKVVPKLTMYGDSRSAVEIFRNQDDFHLPTFTIRQEIKEFDRKDKRVIISMSYGTYWYSG